MLDNIFTLAIIYTTMNLPLGIWLLRSFLLEIRADLFEAARVEGAGTLSEMTRIVLPLVAPGLAATTPDAGRAGSTAPLSRPPAAEPPAWP